MRTVPLKLMAIANVPGPNLNDFFDQVATHEEVDLTVLYCSHKTRKWREGIAASDKHKHIFLRNMNFLSRYGRFQINPGVLRYLIWDRPDLIQIQGYTTPTLFITLSLCRLFGIPFTYWGEEIDRSKAQSRVVIWVKRWVVGCLNTAKHIFVVGTKGLDSYQKLGLSHDRFSTMFYSCDLSPFFNVAATRKTNERKELRGIVTTSQLIDRKRVDILIDSFVALANEFPYWSLHIIGAGENLSALKRRVPNDLQSRVIWHGYLPKSDHPLVYAQCDIFALPSREDGGPMALAEALASGLPAVTTDGVVTARDMVGIPSAGYLVPRDDLIAFQSRLQSLMKDEKTRTKQSVSATQSAKKSDAALVAAEYIKLLQKI